MPTEILTLVGSRNYMLFGGALKIRDWKMRDWNYQHQTAGWKKPAMEYMSMPTLVLIAQVVFLLERGHTHRKSRLAPAWVTIL